MAQTAAEFYTVVKKKMKVQNFPKSLYNWKSYQVRFLTKRQIQHISLICRN